MSPRGRQHLVTRRQALAGACAFAVALAGCTRASEFVADRFTGEVNVFNTIDERLTGSLELVDPDDRTVLDEPLDLAPESGDGGEDREPAVIYEDVLTTFVDGQSQRSWNRTGSWRSVPSSVSSKR